MMNDDARMAFRSAFDSGAPHEDQKEAALRWVADATASKKARERETQVTREEEALAAIAFAEASGDPTKALDKLLEDDPGLLDVLTAPDDVPANAFDLPVPESVIWRENDDPGAYVDAVVSVGEVAVLAAPGGTGKSYLTLALARAASIPESMGGTKYEYGAACGLRVRAGPVMLVSYEDSLVRITHRLRAIAGLRVTSDDPEFRNIRVYRDPGPLFATDKTDPGNARPTNTWHRLWARVRTLEPSLVIIDPASSALPGVPVSEGGMVRRFMTETATEAKKAGCGVLIVAHDTKAARNEARASGNPGAGAIAGSAQWFDAARGVLYLYRCTDSKKRILACIKANHGRYGWGARICEDMRAGKFHGLKLSDDGKDARKARKALLDDAVAEMESDAKRGTVANTPPKPSMRDL